MNHPLLTILITKNSDAQVSNEFICHLPWHMLQTAAFYNAFSAMVPELEGIDALYLYAMDAILKDPFFRKFRVGFRS